MNIEIEAETLLSYDLKKVIRISYSSLFRFAKIEFLGFQSCLRVFSALMFLRSAEKKLARR